MPFLCMTNNLKVKLCLYSINGLNKVGVSDPFTRERKHTQFPKRRALWNTGGWTKSNNSVTPGVMYYRQNPVESTLQVLRVNF
jgi:hypothetical protein